MSTILAVDPGSQQSAYSYIDADTCMPLEHAKIDNDEMRLVLAGFGAQTVVIEQIASYGMPVGAEVFTTCIWVGRYVETMYRNGVEAQLVKRQPVKLHLCGSSRANDGNVRQALVDRFASGQPNHGKGTKAAPGWFYGFAADVWQSYALAVYAADQVRLCGAAACQRVAVANSRCADHGGYLLLGGAA